MTSLARAQFDRGENCRDFHLNDVLSRLTGCVTNLSSAEKALYDKAVTSGNTKAAEGISQIALVRMGGALAGGANGTTYTPLNTEMIAVNIEKYFSHSIIDPSGNTSTNFQALFQFLQNNPSA